MIPRFNARAGDINLQLNLVRVGSLPVEEVLQRNEEGLTEDERLVRLSSSKLTDFVVTMNSQKSQAAVRNAEAVLQQAERDLKRAERDLQQAGDDLAKHVKAAQKACTEASAILVGARIDAAKAEQRESEYADFAREEAAIAKEEKIEDNAHLRKEATAVALIKHLLGSKFPPELRTAVLEAVVRTQRLRWRPAQRDSLDYVVYQTFSLPRALDDSTRDDLREETRLALLKKAIIELSAKFTPSNILDLPCAILGRERDIRHLVLDIELKARDNVNQSQLFRASRGMSALSQRFPTLQAFVVSLLISKDETTNSPASGARSFTTATLMLRNMASWAGAETLQTSLEKFIDVLHQTGPGVVKFVRFVDQNRDGSNSFAHAGPLVRLPPYVAPPPTQDGSGVSGATGSATGDPTVGEQVLGQAYCYHHDTTHRWE